MTRGVDLAVSVVNDAEAEACVRALMDRGYRVLEVLEHGTSGRLSTVRLLPPAHQGGGVLCDLVFATCGVEAEVVASASSLRLAPGVVGPVASIGALVAMKLLSESPARSRDADDLRGLLRVATPSDLVEAERMIELVSLRGFAGGKDLRARFTAYRGEMQG